jgi:hypothetical protein
VNYHEKAWFRETKKIIKFNSMTTTETVRDLTKVVNVITPDYYKLNCVYFNSKKGVPCLKRGGACIQCDYGKCTEAFHVKCALRNGLIVSFDVMESREMKIYCKNHLNKFPALTPQEPVKTPTPKKVTPKKVMLKKVTPTKAREEVTVEYRGGK